MTSSSKICKRRDVPRSQSGRSPTDVIKQSARASSPPTAAQQGRRGGIPAIPSNLAARCCPRSEWQRAGRGRTLAMCEMSRLKASPVLYSIFSGAAENPDCGGGLPRQVPPLNDWPWLVIVESCSARRWLVEPLRLPPGSTAPRRLSQNDASSSSGSPPSRLPIAATAASAPAWPFAMPPEVSGGPATPAWAAAGGPVVPQHSPIIPSRPAAIRRPIDSQQWPTESYYLMPETPAFVCARVPEFPPACSHLSQRCDGPRVAACSAHAPAGPPAAWAAPLRLARVQTAMCKLGK